MAAVVAWSCCECKASNIVPNATRCPLCSHDKCEHCHEGPPSPERSPSPLFSSSKSRYISPHPSSYHATTTLDFPISRPVQPSLPSVTPQQYALGAGPPPPPGPRRNIHDNNGGGGGGYPSASAPGYPSASAFGYSPISTSGSASNSRAGRYSESGGRTGYGQSFTPSSQISDGRGRDRKRPDMRGWWKCCQDGFVNNPELCPVLCATGDHRKCRNCTIY